jgi:NAD kinase
MVDAMSKLHKDNDPRNEPVIKDGHIPALFENSDDESRKKIDFIITLGGDGTILWAAKQFNGSYVPPLISFAHGSLGYLCNFTFEDHKEVIKEVFSLKTKVNLDERMRLKVSCPK